MDLNNKNILLEAPRLSSSILQEVGNTPLLNFNSETSPWTNIFIKLEYFNPTGSMKDRAANFMLTELLEKNIIDANTTIIESSSGNFGVALAAYTKMKRLKFQCVIDPNISSYNLMLLRSFDAEIIMVDEVDENGGYLLNRIRKVKELISQNTNSYWINQYANPMNADAYYYTLGEEIINSIDELDYVFVGVSSGGTISGLSRRLKQHFPKIKVIAVDIDGSVIFGGKPAKRFIPGIGSSMVPAILKSALIDEVISVSETETAKMCHWLLKNRFLFVGGSSGSVWAAIRQYFRNSEERILSNNILAVFPDSGAKYLDTIFNSDWCQAKFGFSYSPLSNHDLPN